MANNNSNRKLVPEAQSALERFKYEVASDMCVKILFEHYLMQLHIFYADFLFNSFISFNSLNLK